MPKCIGLLIILKQIPHALGYDNDPEGHDAFFQISGATTFSAIVRAFESFTPDAALIAVISFAILFFLGGGDKVITKKYETFQLFRLHSGTVL